MSEVQAGASRIQDPANTRQGCESPLMWERKFDPPTDCYVWSVRRPLPDLPSDLDNGGGQAVSEFEDNAKPPPLLPHTRNYSPPLPYRPISPPDMQRVPLLQAHRTSASSDTGPAHQHAVPVTMPRGSLTRMAAPLSTDRIVTDITMVHGQTHEQRQEQTHEHIPGPHPIPYYYVQIEPQEIITRARVDLTRMAAPVAEGRDTGACAQTTMSHSARTTSPGKTSLYSPSMALRGTETLSPPTEADVKATIAAANLAAVKAAGDAREAAVNAKAAQTQDEKHLVATESVTRQQNDQNEAAVAKRVKITRMALPIANQEKDRKLAKDSAVAGARSHSLLLPLVMLMLGMAVGWVLRGAVNSVGAVHVNFVYLLVCMLRICMLR